MPPHLLRDHLVRQCHEDHGFDRWCHFIIPQAILQNPSSVNEESDLLELPNELLLLIFSYSDTIGKLSLALACKQLLSVAAMTTLRIPSAARHHANLTSGCPGMLGVLHALAPRNARGKLKNAVALCCDCYRYQTRAKTYWKRVRKDFPSDEACLYLEGYDYRVDAWSRPGTATYQCPRCWCEERTRRYG